QNELGAVLDRIDADLDASLERLFAWLRIPSISTDPAYAGHCRGAAEWLTKAIAEIGFDGAIRETPGHPVVVARAADGRGPNVMFYGHYDVQPVDPLHLWQVPPFE